MKKQRAIDSAEATSSLPSHTPLPLSSLHEQGMADNAKEPYFLPSRTPQPLSLLHKQGTTNNAKVLLSALPPPPPPLLSHEQGAINGVKAPLPLPSCVLLPSPWLHEQGATNSTKVLLSSMHEQGKADKFEALIIIAQAGGNQQRQDTIVWAVAAVTVTQVRDDQQCQGAIVNAASACMCRG
jgi:hypothetical protein